VGLIHNEVEMTEGERENFIDHLYTDILDALHKINNLDEIARNEIESQEHIFKNAIELAQHIRNLLEVVKTHLMWEYHPEIKNISKKFNSVKYERLRKRISEATRVVASLTPIIKYIYGSNVQNNKWGIVTYIERFCRQLYPNTRVVILPKWENNYFYSSIKDLAT
jgi:hypothetical protein